MSTSAPGVVDREEPASGTVAGVPTGHEVWIVVEIGGYYPQDGPVPVGNDGAWSANVVFGGPGTFVVHLVETGPAGSELFREYFRVGRATGDFAPIARIDLPGDVTFLDRVAGLRRTA